MMDHTIELTNPKHLKILRVLYRLSPRVAMRKYYEYYKGVKHLHHGGWEQAVRSYSTQDVMYWWKMTHPEVVNDKE